MWAWLALAIVVSFVGATFTDGCLAESAMDSDAEGCPPGCHIACLDGCAVAPIETAMLVSVAIEARREPRTASASSPLELDFPPELIPPRA